MVDLLSCFQSQLHNFNEYSHQIGIRAITSGEIIRFQQLVSELQRDCIEIPSDAKKKSSNEDIVKRIARSKEDMTTDVV